MVMVFWKIVLVFCYGNVVVWKLVNVIFVFVVVFMEIIVKQDILKGLFSFVMGVGGMIGQVLVESFKVDVILFIGFVFVGKGIVVVVIQNLIKVQMEMGFKNVLVVMDDVNLDLVVLFVLGGVFGGMG